jgi:hypothetical protein
MLSYIMYALSFYEYICWRISNNHGSSSLAKIQVFTAHICWPVSGFCQWSSFYPKYFSLISGKMIWDNLIFCDVMWVWIILFANIYGPYWHWCWDNLPTNERKCDGKIGILIIVQDQNSLGLGLVRWPRLNPLGSSDDHQHMMTSSGKCSCNVLPW